MERYEAYKDSGIEWIGEIPECWSVKRIKSLIRDLRVGPFGSAIKTDDYCDEGVPLYTQETVLRRNWTVSKHITNEKATELQSFVANPGDYLITTRGTLGCVYELPSTCEKGVIHPCLMRFRIDDDLVDGRFLMFALNDSNELIEQVLIASSSSTIPVLYSWTLRNAYIAAPPIHYQQAIADYLDAKTAEIDALVADCEREVELLREYRKAVISEAVTKGLDPDSPMKDSGVEWIGEIPEDWFCSSLNRVIKTIQTGPFGSQLHAEDYSNDGDVCVVNPANIIGGKIHPSTCNRISRELASSLSQHLMREGEIVFGRRGEMGRCALVEVDGLFCGTGSIEMELLETVVPAFAVYYLQCDFVKSYLELRSVGTTLQNLNTGIIATTPFVVAPVEEQEAIVTYLDAKTAEIDSFIEAKQSMAGKLREYRRSLISEAVTGKFKVPGV